MSSLAEKLDHLFSTCRRTDGKQYTYDDVQKGTGGEVSHTYAWKLHKGHAANPGYQKLAALAEFFGVPITYFYDESLESREYVGDLHLARALRQNGVQQIALRARGLDESAKKNILAMIEYARQAQGLDGEVAPSTGPGVESKDGEETRPD